MNSTTLPFSIAGSLSSITSDYLQNAPKLNPFVYDFHQQGAIQKRITTNNFEATKRQVLVSSLKNQYQQVGLQAPAAVDLLLKETTFTVTTGHQLCLFGGPKYFIYKIVSAIKLARQLNAENPSTKVLPVFWMASEDHDFEEINKVTLFKNSLATTQPASGPVGRLKPAVFVEVYDQLVELFKNDTRANELLHHFEKSFTKDSWAAATRYWVHQLFGDELLIIDGDDKALKQLFVPILIDEVKNKQSQVAIEQSNDALKELGYHIQVNPREINLFYMEDGLRELLLSDQKGGFEVRNTALQFSEAVLIDLINHSPEKFSPNVTLRPVYQEVILPNVAYIGGPGELAYWLQLKSNFDRLQVPFPILVLRDSFLLVQQKELTNLQDMKLHLEDLFLPEHDLIKKYLNLNSTVQLDFSDNKEQLTLWQQELIQKLVSVDKDFEKMLGAEFSNWNKLFDRVEQKLVKSEKNKEEVVINRLLKIKSNYLPNGILNERVDSFIPEWTKDENYIQTLLENSDTYTKSIKVLFS